MGLATLWVCLNKRTNGQQCGTAMATNGESCGVATPKESERDTHRERRREREREREREIEREKRGGESSLF